MPRLRHNLIANYFGQFWAAVMALAFIPLYIAYLGMEAYGLIGLYAVVQAWLGLLDAGMTPTLNREMARFSAGARSAQSMADLLRSLEIVCAGVAALIALGAWSLSGPVARSWLLPGQLPVETLMHAIALMGLVIALRLCESIYAGSLIGLQQQLRYNALHATLATLRHGGAVGVLAWYSPTIEAFFGWQAIISALAVVLLAANVRRLVPGPSARFSLAALAGIRGFAGSMMAITFLGLLLTQADKILLSRLLPLERFGYYALAASVAGALYLVVAPITQALYPRMVELAASRDERSLVSLYHQGAQSVTVLTAPAALVLCSFAAGTIYAWSGDRALAESTAPILSVLALGTFLHGLMWMPYHARLAHGWTGLTLKVNSVAVLVLVPAILWLVPQYGALAAAWIWVALNCGYVLIAIHLMHRRLMPGEKWRWYFADVLLPTAGAGAAVLLARLLQPAQLDHRGEWLAFLVVSGLAALAASAALSDRVRARWSPGITRKHGPGAEA